MKIDVVTLDNQPSGEIELAESVFAAPVRQDILARMVNWQLARRRAGTHKVKTRGEIRATGAKMFRQKGTGHARHGSKSVSQFRGGGRAFGPVVRDHAHDLPKKVRALALRSALSAKHAAGRLLILEDAFLQAPKTAELIACFEKLGLSNALIMPGASIDRCFGLAARNIPHIDVLPVQGANVYDILRRELLVLTRAGVAGLEARLG